MAYDELLADRMRNVLKEKKTPYAEKQMMGGLAFMVDDKMCVGIIKDEMMVRLAPDDAEVAIHEPGLRRMNFTGRPMKGFIIAGQEAIDLDKDLELWIDRALAFNPFAKSSKRRGKK